MGPHRKLLFEHLRYVVSAVAIEYTAHGQRLQWFWFCRAGLHLDGQSSAL